MDLPKRQQLPHTPPGFVPSGEIYFLTICGQPRGENQFACAPAWTAIVAAAQHYHRIGRWHCRLLLAMPDHVHALASFPIHETMKRVIATWKHFLSGNARRTWQRDSFDHRLRTHESADEKAVYIRANPLRAGLVTRNEDWPFVRSPPDIAGTPFR